LGLKEAGATALVAAFELAFPLPEETPDVYPEWRAIADGLGVIGKQVHDARLVAVCHVHRVTHLLTFGTGHFTRLATAPPGVIILDPATV